MTDAPTFMRWTRSISTYAIVIPIVSLIIVAVLNSETEAQTEGEKNAFTVEDLLNLKSFSVNDITEDGRFLVCTTSRRMSRFGNDYSRYGDPTYLAPGGSEVFIMDGLTGEMTPLFDEEVQARGFSWSPDGTMLAFLLRKDDEYLLHTYDHRRDRVREVRVRTDKPLSSSSSLSWLPDGSGVLISLREEGWKERARNQFLAITEGPIIVHDSNEPFLKWDAIDTTAALSIPAIVDLHGGRSPNCCRRATGDRYGSPKTDPSSPLSRTIHSKPSMHAQGDRSTNSPCSTCRVLIGGYLSNGAKRESG